MSVSNFDIVEAFENVKGLLLTQEWFDLWGCPNCGYNKATILEEDDDDNDVILKDDNDVNAGSLFRCGACKEEFAILGKDQNEIYVKIDDVGFVMPEKHPRHGIPAHGDLTRFVDSEYFKSDGIGFRKCPCFVCGTKKFSRQREPGWLNSIAAFVRSKEAGERIVAMFTQGARLDHDDYQENLPLVIVGACCQHLTSLMKLQDLTQFSCSITPDIIRQAKELASPACQSKTK